MARGRAAAEVVGRRAGAAAGEEARQHDGVEEYHRACDDGEERDEEADLPLLPVEEALRVEQEGRDASRRAAQREHKGSTQPVEAAPSLAEQRAHEHGRRAARAGREAGGRGRGFGSGGGASGRRVCARRRRTCGDGCASAKHTGDTAYTAAQVPHSPAKPTAERRASVAASRPHTCTSRPASSGPTALT
eukprot:scaffold96777_cov63-Phaeocystis_antarctica.AAC.5